MSGGCHPPPPPYCPPPPTSITWYGGNGNDAFAGAEYGDYLSGAGGNDTLYGNGGNDTLIGGAGNDSLLGGEGDDLMYVDSTGDFVDGGNGTDRINSSIDFDLSDTTKSVNVEYLEFTQSTTGRRGTGNALNNRITGGSGNDTLIGGGGDDTLNGGKGADSLDGGADSDTYYVDNIDDKTTDSGTTGTDTVITSIDIATLDISIENLTLLAGSAAIRGTGNANANIIRGQMSKSSILDGAGGNDTLIGGNCADTLIGGEGADSMVGGTGNDYYVVDDVGDIIYDTSGFDTLESKLQTINLSEVVSGTTLRYNGVENVVLGTGAISAMGNNSNNKLTGNAGNNTLDGGVGNDTLDGGTGSDLLLGGAGTDSLLGGAGEFDDTLDGGTGSDYMAGGAGSDTYHVDSLWDSVKEVSTDSGKDTVIAKINNYTLAANIENLILEEMAGVTTGTGNSSDNHIKGNSLANVLSGGAGADTLDGGAGMDTLHGGTGNDTYIVDSEKDVVKETDATAAGGIDKIIVENINYSLADIANVENLELRNTSSSLVGQSGRGNSLKNHITAGKGEDTLFGDAGSDTLDGGAGKDTLDGGADADLLLGGEGDDKLDGGQGDDTLDGGTGSDTMLGGDGNDVYLVESDTDRVIDSNGAMDTVYSTAQNYRIDTSIEKFILAGTGNISGTGNLENNHITGNSGNNTLNGEAGNDTLLGGDGNDNLQGGLDADSLLGDNGDDTLDGGTGADTMEGGSGNDTYIVDNLADVIRETGTTATGGTDKIVAENINYSLVGKDTIENLELRNTSLTLLGQLGIGNSNNNLITAGGGSDTLFGEDGSDTLDGGSNNDFLNGGNGADSLLGQAGSDNLDGGQGDDTLDGGTDSDTMSGGNGNDVYFVDSETDIVIDSEGSSDTVISSAQNYTLASGIENYVLSGIGNINGTGNTQNNFIKGNSGNNTLDGGAGSDTLDGGDGNDSLLGGLDADSLLGGKGNDTLDGGLGADTMDGGEGNNTFYIDSKSDVVIKNTINSQNEVVLNISTANDPSLADWYDQYITNKITKLKFVGALFNTAEFSDDQLQFITINLVNAGDSWTGSEQSDTRTDNTGRNSSYFGLGGNDTLDGGAGNDTLDGGDGADSLIGGTGNDSLIGGEGADILDGGTGADTMIGGDGDDIYVVDASGDVINETGSGSSSGTDTVRTLLNSYTLGANLENLVFTGTGGNTGTGNALNNRITGNSGNDTLDGGAGADTMDGGLGNNTYVIDNINDRVIQAQINAGNTVTLRIDAALNFSGLTNDQIKKLLLSNNDLTADQLAQITLEFAGNPVIDLGPGNNNYKDDLNRDSSIFGGDGNDTIDGGGGNDTLDGGADNDSLIGGLGNDILDGGTGNDTMTGGEGNDIYIVRDEGDTVIDEISNQGNDTVLSYIDFYQLGANIENLKLMDGAILGYGNELANSLTGNEDNNYLKGERGADTLDGGGGDDTLSGGADNDILRGGNGADSLDGGQGQDTMDGGLGNNTYVIDNLDDRFVQTTIDATNKVVLNVDSQLAFNLDLTDSEIISSLTSQKLTADQLSNITLKFTGTTTYTGTVGSAPVNDTFVDKGRSNSSISGLNGDDTLDGAAGNDTIYGDEGNDHLIGGRGNDELWGGEGSDVFSWSRTDVIAAKKVGYADVIKDFDPSDYGTKLSRSLANSNDKDMLDLSDLLQSLGYNKNSLNTDLNDLTKFLKLETNGNNTVFTIDLDGAGSGTVAQTITLENTTFKTETLDYLISNSVLKV